MLHTTLSNFMFFWALPSAITALAFIATQWNYRRILPGSYSRAGHQLFVAACVIFPWGVTEIARYWWNKR